jgi:5-methyltetrahydropteroyltriglutamate--homocysteine methyltransferase
MALVTTTIGAYPKPSYVPITDWFDKNRGPDQIDPTSAYLSELAAAGDEAEASFVTATHEIVRDQVNVGIDIPTDGEVRRENYIHYHCRHLDGIDFDHLSEHMMRGNYLAHLPTITGKVLAQEPFLPKEWRVAQEASQRPVKMTIPGPMTIADTVVDAHYGDLNILGRDLANAINEEVRALAEAGCRHIQIDEPLFARKAAEALDYGIDNFNLCFDGLDDTVTKTIHICCGYPNKIDNPNYRKAPRESYFELAEALDASTADAISLEDAHRHNDLDTLLPRIRESIVVFGAVAIAESRIETESEISVRLKQALNHIEAERLWAAPDCGLGLLSRGQALAKLGNLTSAARKLG